MDRHLVFWYFVVGLWLVYSMLRLYDRLVRRLT